MFAHGMYFPTGNKNKVAISSAEIFAAQRELSTHSVPMQILLTKLKDAVAEIYGLSVPRVTDLEFSINVSSPETLEEKVFSVKLKAPVKATLHIRERVDIETLSATWYFVDVAGKGVAYRFCDTGEQRAAVTAKQLEVKANLRFIQWED